ncbi:MBL fold metallo-hydrolase [Shewanella sp. Isolate7]|uniref:MBL fold metallo-hydrolase n=1 Tax=Shewanella sp. Isolate7 TaxID=2908528 RepID=UPI001EFDAF88|nr:MBL fold metallo-hydrolase [Shewanella sp. Isolate7]MCG9723605.1 MBL fold metallo-hydrolase [Shewanella sp. Isolate7]
MSTELYESYFLIIGCGHSEAVENFNNNALLHHGNQNLLVDCGHTVKHALNAQSLNIGQIDAIFITHVHGDHVFGLERVAYESKFKYQKKIKLILREEVITELWSETLKGSLGYNSDGSASLEDYFDLVILKEDYFFFNGLRIDLVRVNHTPGKSTHGIVVDNKIFYSSDTLAIPETINTLDFKVGFHDVTLSDFNPVHATLDSLINEYSYDIRKKLYLMSYEDSWREYQNIVEDNFRGYATQGMKVLL